MFIWRVNKDKNSINKYEMCRKILERLNENTDKHLRERREILKRITEFEAYSTCWENDQLKAKGLVAEIRNVINVKDSFTRMKMERESESAKRKEEYLIKMREIQDKRQALEIIKNDFYSLFSDTNPQKRGKDLERVMNAYFSEYQILIKENFTRSGEAGEGIIEQIDGIIELDGQIYLVEMKWKKDSIGSDDIYAHLGRIYHRACAHGIYISASEYTPSALVAAREALVKNTLLVMCNLKDFVSIIESEYDLRQYLKDKIQAAIIDKDPYRNVLS